MLTIEKFYFTFTPTVAEHILVDGDGRDWSIEFIGEPNDAPVSVKITIRGRKNFRQLLKHIHRMGMGLLRSHETPAVAEDAPAETLREA